MAETLEESSPLGEIDTSAPFESVREAATRFGGFGLWKPSSHNIPQNETDMMSKANELEKELIAKEREALKVLKSLECIKSIVKELKLKLQHKEEKENFDINILKELNQAKMSFFKTSEDLALIRKSVELLNKRLVDERDEVEKFSSNEAKEISRTQEDARFAVEKAVAEIEKTRNKIEIAEMRLVAARKMKEAARAAEAVAVAEINAVTGRRRRRRRMFEEGLERRPSTSNTVLMMNGDGTASSVAVMKPTMSIGQILSRKLLADESTMMMNGRVSLGQILGKTSIKDMNGDKRLNAKRKRFGLAKLSVMLNKDSKKNKKTKIALNLN